MATIAIQVGIAVAGAVLSAVFAPKPPTVYGSRLSDLNLTAVSPGNPLNKCYGTISVGCACIFGTGLKETQNTTKVKGGKGAPKTPKQVTYTYSTDVAMAMCEGPISKVRRIWANSKVLYSSIIVTGPDAIKVQAAAATVRGIAQSLEGSSDDTIGGAGTGLSQSEKGRMRTLFTSISAQLTNTVYPAMELAQLINDDNTPGSTGQPLNYIAQAWKDFTDYWTITIHPGLYEDGDATITKDAAQSAYNNIETALTGLAEDLDTAAAGSADAYVDGQAQAQATNALAGLDADNAFAASLAFMISQQKGKATDPTTNQRYDRINVYTGTESQMPDDIIEGHLGVGQVPAYRGTAYFVVEELQLADFGNALPTMKAEIEQLDASGQTTIKTIVTDLCLRSGMDPSYFDVTKLPDATISGFAITQTASARDALQTLQNVVHFDVVESNYQVKFIDRYPATVARLRREDMSTREYDGDGSSGATVPSPVQTVRGMEDELPYKIIFNYQDPTRDFSAGTCQAIRNTGNVNLVTTVDLTMALTPTEAKTAVDLAMMTSYAQRRSYKIFMPLKYAILDPGDVILLPPAVAGSSQDRKLRITGTALGANKIIELDLTDHVVPADNVTGLAYTPVIPSTEAYATGTTTAFILDTPILTEDEDDTQPGLYVGFSKISKGWAGGALFVDEGSGGSTPLPGGGTSEDDDEVQWSAVASSTIDLPHGKNGYAWADASPYLWDRTSKVLVAVSTPDFTPSTVAESTILKGANNSIIVNGEIMQFANVDDLGGSGLYLLSDFLRGRRGTESFIQAHAINSDVLFIDVDDLQRFTIGASELGLEQDYKTANVNQDISSQPIIPVIAQGNSLKPYAPCHVRRDDADDGSDITFSWQPRVRQGGVWLDSTDPIIDQATEKYEIDIFDGATFKRTLAVDGARSVVYTSGDQATDFGARPALGAITVRAYQLGAIIGRGFTNPIAL